MPMPTYTAVALNSPVYDPCTNYTSLDQPWRASNETRLGICDADFNWNGWYRLFYYGMDIRMAESCIPTSRCGTDYTLWLNGPHPQIEDGVVTRQACGNGGSDCCYYKAALIHVKACPGNYYVYELFKPSACNMTYCADANTTTPTPASPTEDSVQSDTTITPTTNNFTFDPCYNYSVLDNNWRSTKSYSYKGRDDTLVKWNGWYRLYLQGVSAQMSEWCMSYMTCGGYTPLSLGGSHPQPEDGIVTREVYGSSGSQCTAYRSKPIQVKACPGDYYVYKFVKPDISIPMPSYCAVTVNHPNYDPCNNYTALDQPWRANNVSGFGIVDDIFKWNGWYRLLFYGNNIRMAESCVPTYRCSGRYTLWLNGPHPQIEDGVVTRQVCGNQDSNCYRLKSLTIQVKACPGNFYVYEFVRPGAYDMVYCSDSSSITPASVPVTNEDFNMNMTPDPCNNYTVLNDSWRTTYRSYGYESYDDTTVNWNGWYRLYLQGKSAQLSEACLGYISCGGYTPLMLNESHPLIQDGIVTREVYGAYYSECRYYKSNPIQVKACPGHYYVYKLVKPNVSIPMPTYCAAAFDKPTYDPCTNYTSLDQPWRATNAIGLKIYDGHFTWNGWYRMFNYGMDIRMAESCVNVSKCGTYYTLWLNGPHPQIEDGVIARQVCGNSGSRCCFFQFFAIQVKACPNNYYVYEIYNPYYYFGNSYYYYYYSNRHLYYNSAMAYCTDSSTITPTLAPVIADTGSRVTMPITPTSNNFDPCYNYTALNDYRRGITSSYSGHGNDDTLIQWNGWYRLYLQGKSAQLSEWCVSDVSCGGYTPLILGGTHPKIQDGIVTRDIHVFSDGNCNYFSRSSPIQVKACPGQYYVYKLVKPYISIPLPGYCTASFTYPTTDPCNNYNVLNDIYRATSSTNEIYQWSLFRRCDTDNVWNGWYRLSYQGNNARMPESCVSPGRCESNAPLWLNGGHPRLEDGIVTRQVCGSTYQDCCYYKSYPIQVKACPGNYYVYEFIRPLTCAVYCIDVASITSISAPGILQTTTSMTVATTTATKSTTTGLNPHEATTLQQSFTTGVNSITPPTTPVHSETAIVESTAVYATTTTESTTTDVNLHEATTVQQSFTTDVYSIAPPTTPKNAETTAIIKSTAVDTTTTTESTTTEITTTEINLHEASTVERIFTTETSTTKIKRIGNTTSGFNATTAHLYTCMKLNCTVDEWCGEKDGLYGCFCNESHSRSRPEVYDSRETCESSSGTMSLSRCQLFEAGFPAHVLHLSDPRCRGTLQNGRLVFHFDNDDHICGTNLTANGTHFIYENSIQGVVDSAHGPINRQKHLELQFSCVYQLRQTLTMETTLYALHSMVHKTLPSGQGMYRVRMIPYQDAAFTHPYNGSVNIVVDQRIYVEVAVQGVDSRQIATVIDSCWASPVNDQTFAVRWDLIINECPNPDDGTVEVLQNGVSTTGHFSFKMFSFNGNYSKVFLHCAIHLCLYQGNNCAAHCFPGHHHRVRRSLDIHDTASISVGPFVWTAGSRGV
ncbi:uncharacterized protein LOC118804505 [Colossoma macropomum]|uniref:uncharacterized protein LOC118804505 n=1 Tax=Colossoma macropomum TaxID=42526 RepID=UPI0018651089|nr:uncharacterized protein LOC118804505 [Colossoma macropomum]